MPGPTALSNAEIDLYSTRLSIESGLNANGWTKVEVNTTRNGWPTAEEITVGQSGSPVAQVYVSFHDNQVVGYELGSHGKSREMFAHIYALNPSVRDRVAEEITNLIRDDGLDTFAFVTGNESAPAATGRLTAEWVRWRPTPMPSNAPLSERFRAVVIADLRRAE